MLRCLEGEWWPEDEDDVLCSAISFRFWGNLAAKMASFDANRSESLTLCVDADLEEESLP